MIFFKNKLNTIEIPKPCHESWAEMTPTEQGQFCSSCQKCVTDFTSMKMDSYEMLGVIVAGGFSRKRHIFSRTWHGIKNIFRKMKQNFLNFGVTHALLILR